MIFCLNRQELAYLLPLFLGVVFHTQFHLKFSEQVIHNSVNIATSKLVPHPRLFPWVFLWTFEVFLPPLSFLFTNGLFITLSQFLSLVSLQNTDQVVKTRENGNWICISLVFFLHSVVLFRLNCQNWSCLPFFTHSAGATLAACNQKPALRNSVLHANT